MGVLLCAPELAPIVTALEAVRGQRGPAVVHGVVPGLLVDDPSGWTPATRYADGSALPDLLTAAARRWDAGPAAAAALAWKSYTYWLTLPAVLGYATAGRVPDLSPDNVLVRLHGAEPFLEIGLRRPAVAVTPADPLAGRPGVEVSTDLPGYLRRTALDAHLEPVLEALRGLVNVGRRNLLGSLASGVAYGLTRAAGVLPDPVLPAADQLLTALGVDHLVEIDAGLGVRRRTCCLAFTLPQPKVCSGCCLIR